MMTAAVPMRTLLDIHGLTCQPLDGDFAGVSRMMQASWKQNAEQALDYDAPYLASCFSSPGKRPVVAPALYHEGRLAAFVAGFPRSVVLAGRRLELALMTFFTVAPEWKGKGLGAAIWAECLHQARAAGYDGAVHYCVEGNLSNAVTAKAARQAGWEARKIFTVRHLMRLVRPGAAAAADGEEWTSEFLEGAGALREQAALARIWSPGQARWQLQERYGAVTAGHRENGAGGVLSGYTMRTADGQGTRCLFIEDILWNRLEEQGRVRLVQKLLAQTAGAVDLAVVPLLGCADMAPFSSAGFRRSTRVLHAYLTLWGAETPAGELASMYLDVL